MYIYCIHMNIIHRLSYVFLSCTNRRLLLSKIEHGIELNEIYFTYKLHRTKVSSSSCKMIKVYFGLYPLDINWINMKLWLHSEDLLAEKFIGYAGCCVAFIKMTLNWNILPFKIYSTCSIVSQFLGQWKSNLEKQVHFSKVESVKSDNFRWFLKQ